VSDAELERLRTEYRRRDAAGAGPYRWDNPGYVSYMQDLERSLLRAFAGAGLELTGASVLDVGCGTGYYLHRLREYGAGPCHGIDLMEQRIAEARERYPALDFRVATATELPFERGAVDLATQFTCLSSILDEDVRTKAAAEMQRVAAGGWVLSFDLRSDPRGSGGTPSIGLGPRELRRLFGAPAFLRRVTLRFSLAQSTGRHDVLARALGTLPPLRSHYLGLWRVPG
jgi:SAM-dependent methyltransferase